MSPGSEHLTRAMRSLEAAFLIGIEGVTEIWLVRHADAYDSVVDVSDPPLSSRGREQATRLADRLRRVKPAAVYSSPYRRAFETAQYISGDVHVDHRLVEVALEIGEDGSLDFKEASGSVVARMRAVIDDMVTAHNGELVVAISHAAAIAACISDVLQLEPGQLRVLPYYTSVSTVRVLGERRMLGSFGDVAHLE